MVFIFFILTLLSSLSAVIFVNADFNLAFAKKSSHSGGGGSKDNGNGDNVGSNGGSGDNTTTPSIAQGTTNTPSIAQGNITSPETSINAPLTTQQQYPMTPQQKYEQCLSGIGGGIPGNCKPPSSTTTEQNLPPQTLSPQQTCQDGSTPSANGICQNGSTPQQACPGNVGRDANGICFSPAPIITCPLHTVRLANYVPLATDECVPPFNIDLYNGSLLLGDGKLRMLTTPPVPNTNTIAPICPVYSYLAGSKCILNNYVCPSGYTQDEDICTPTIIHAKIFVPPCASGYYREFIGGECLPIPPATANPTNTPPLQP